MLTTTACHSFDHVASCECQGPKYQCLGSVGFELREGGNVSLRSAEERSGPAPSASLWWNSGSPLSSRGPVVVPLFLYTFVLLCWASSSSLRCRVSTYQYSGAKPGRPCSSSSSPRGCREGLGLHMPPPSAGGGPASATESRICFCPSHLLHQSVPVACVTL